MMIEDAPKMRKNGENLRKITKNGPNKEGNQNDDALRVPSSRRGEALPTGDLCVVVCGSSFNTRRGRDPRALGRSAGLRETARGPWHRRTWTKSAKPSQNPSKSIQKPSKPFENVPKTLPEPSKIDPKSIQKASWTPSWTHGWKKINLEHQKNGEKAPKSAQKTDQTVPNPSQIEPKTLP